MRLLSRRVLPALAAVLVLAVSACGDSSHGSMSASGGGESSSVVTGTGAEGDVEFAQMMIPHHEQAVEMAMLALASETASVDVKALATQIEAAQDPEIQTMKGWLAEWGAAESSGPMDHGAGGMMSDDSMTALEGASGAEFDRLWVEMMIEHHEGAVEMAQDVLASTADTEVEGLATAIVEGQQQEIATMQGMLS